MNAIARLHDLGALEALDRANDLKLRRLVERQRGALYVDYVRLETVKLEKNLKQQARALVLRSLAAYTMLEIGKSKDFRLE